MIRNRYKFGFNYCLLPKIQIKQNSPSLITYAFMNSTSNRQYYLFIHPNNKNILLEFNQNEYLQRQCSFICSDKNQADTIKRINELYPINDHTLSIFIANQSFQCDRTILGLQQRDSLLSLAYKQIKKRKKETSAIVFSIIGIQNENTITDQLNFEWLQGIRESTDNQEPIKSIIKQKPKIKVIMNEETKYFKADNLSTHEIQSQDNLIRLLRRYSQMKNYWEEWVSLTNQSQLASQGQLFQLSQVQYDSQTGHIVKTLKCHKILRINQYLRSTSSLMLNLGIHLRKIQQNRSQIIRHNESKLFKLIAECFNARVDQGRRKYQFHLFFQVGYYPTLKEEYVNLVPFSQSSTNRPQFKNLQASPFVYIKHYMEFPSIAELVSQIRVQNKFTILPKKLQSLNIMNNSSIRDRLKTKSYICDTNCSIQKKIGKARMFTQQSTQNKQKMNLQELIHETANRLQNHNHQKIKLQNKIKINKFNKFLSFSLSKQSGLNSIIEQKQTKKKKSNFKNQNICHERQRIVTEHISSPIVLQEFSNFYKQTQDWLELVYGRSSRREKGSKSLMTKKANNKLIKSMTKKILQQKRFRNVNDTHLNN